MKRLITSFFLALLIISCSQMHGFKTKAASVSQTVAAVTIIENSRPNVPDANQIVPGNTNATASRGQPHVGASLPQTNTAPMGWWFGLIGLLLIGITMLFYKKERRVKV